MDGLAPTLGRDLRAFYAQQFVDRIAGALDVHTQPVLALDLACGDGAGTLTLLARLPQGSRLIALAEDRGDLRAFHERLDPKLAGTVFPRKEERARLPFARNIFALTWASLALDRLADLRATLRHALRVLRPGGLLVLAVPLADTLVGLVNTVSERMRADTQTMRALLARTTALDLDTWTSTLERCGAIEVNARAEQFEVTLAPPLSAQPLLSQCLLPLWVGDDVAQQAKVLRLLDAHIDTPVPLTVHVGVLRCRRGMVDIEDAAD